MDRRSAEIIHAFRNCLLRGVQGSRGEFRIVARIADAARPFFGRTLPENQARGGTYDGLEGFRGARLLPDCVPRQSVSLWVSH
jgi:hypothetical protein